MAEEGHPLHERSLVIRQMMGRKRRMYGYTSSRAGCHLIEKGKVPIHFDRICCEGDERWTKLPGARPLNEGKK